MLGDLDLTKLLVVLLTFINSPSFKPITPVNTGPTVKPVLSASASRDRAAGTRAQSPGIAETLIITCDLYSEFFK